MGNEHNGWTNYETWLVQVWMTNDQQVVDDLAKAQSVDELRTMLIAQVEDGAPSGASLHCDLFNAALAKVNWMELAAELALWRRESLCEKEGGAK